MRIVISSGHGKYVRGAAGPPPWGLDEVDEARKVVEQVASYLRDLFVDVETFHDDVSTSQDDNLRRIVDYHNALTRDLDVSVHFNAYNVTTAPMGTEVLYVTQDELAAELAAEIADAGGLIDRGAKYRGDLYFLNNTEMPAVLIETCFCDSMADAESYRQTFDGICEVIAQTLTGEVFDDRPRPPEPQPEPPPLTEENRVDILGVVEGEVTVMVNGQRMCGGERCRNLVVLNIAMTGDVVVSINGQDFHNQETETPPEPPFALVPAPVRTWAGRCSWFGGPDDEGVAPDEGLAFLYEVSDAPYLFLDEQPPGTTGLARRLNPEVYYVAVRWDYDETPKTMLASYMARVRSPGSGRAFLAYPADWGPHEDTGRVADISPGLMRALGIATDDEIEVVYPIAPYSGL